MDPQRQGWARQQQEVRRLLASGPHDEAMALWLRQHAALHAAPLAGLPADQVRRRSGPGSRSIAWLLWHATRIEDVTMNLLVAGTAQVLDSASWLSRLGLAGHDVGTAMDDDEVAAVSDRLDLGPPCLPPSGWPAYPGDRLRPWTRRSQDAGRSRTHPGPARLGSLVSWRPRACRNLEPLDYRPLPDDARYPPCLYPSE